MRNLRQVTQQQQPCGVDLTLLQVSRWTSAATIDFDNTKRKAAKTSNLPFDYDNTITLPSGAYLIDFNETVQVPRNCMGSIFTRSSLWRSGVGIAAGVVDAGYEGAMGALMEVNSPHEVVLHQEAKLAQVVFEELGRRSRDIVASTSPQQAVLDAMGQSKRKISHATTEPDPSDCQA